MVVTRRAPRSTCTATSQTWDANSNLLSQTDANLHTTSYTFNDRNLKTATIYADDTLSSGGTFRDRNEVLTFDNDDLPTSTDDSNGSVFTLAYDPEHRRVSLTSAAPSPNTWSIVPVAQTWSLDGLSRVVKATDSTGGSSPRTVTQSWDSLSRSFSETQDAGVFLANPTTISRTFDANNNKTGLVYPNGRQLAFGYLNTGGCCTLNRLQSVTDSSGTIAAFGYIGPSRMLSRLVGNGFAQLSVTHDGLRRPISVNHQFSQSGSLIVGFGYAYDPEGNRLFEQYFHNPGTSPGTFLADYYNFDSVSRITQESRHVSSVTGGSLPNNVLPGTTPSSTAQQTVWTLDGADNRLTQGVTGTTPDMQTYSPNSVNEYSSINDSVTGLNARTHDHNGNVVFDQARNVTYQFDALNRLVAAYNGNVVGLAPVPPTAASAGIIHLSTWDALNRRTRRTVPGSAPIAFQTDRVYFHDGPTVIEERSPTAVMLAQYVWTGTLLQVLDGLGTFYCHENSFGNVHAVTVGNAGNELGGIGTVVDRMDYSIFGSYRCLLSSNPLLAVSGSPYFWQGLRSDPELLLTRNGVVLWDASTARTVSRLTRFPNAYVNFLGPLLLAGGGGAGGDQVERIDTKYLRCHCTGLEIHTDRMRSSLSLAQAEDLIGPVADPKKLGPIDEFGLRSFFAFEVYATVEGNSHLCTPVQQIRGSTYTTIEISRAPGMSEPHTFKEHKPRITRGYEGTQFGDETIPYLDQGDGYIAWFDAPGVLTSGEPLPDFLLIAHFRVAVIDSDRTTICENCIKQFHVMEGQHVTTEGGTYHADHDAHHPYPKLTQYALPPVDVDANGVQSPWVPKMPD